MKDLKTENPNALSFTRSGVLFLDGSPVDKVDIRKQLFWYIRLSPDHSTDIFKEIMIAFFRFLWNYYHRSLSPLSTHILNFSLFVADHNYRCVSKSNFPIIVLDPNPDVCPVPVSGGPVSGWSGVRMSGGQDYQSHSGVGVFYCNTRSLVPKADVLLSYVSIHHPHIIAVTETWLDDNVPSALFCPAGYVSYRCDRSSGKGGGSLLMVHENTLSSPLSLTSCAMDTTSTGSNRIDAVACQLRLVDNNNLNVLCIYHPPQRH